MSFPSTIKSKISRKSVYDYLWIVAIFLMMNVKTLISLFKRAKNNKTIINGSLFSLFSFFGQGVSFVLLILLANYILPTEYGQLSLFSTVVTLVGIVMAFSTRGYPAVTFFKKNTDDFKKDFTASIVLGLISTVILALPVLFYGDKLGELLGLSKTLLWYVLIISFFSFTFLLQQDYLRIKEKVVSYGIYNCGLAIFNFVLSLLFVITLKQSWMGRVDAWVIGSVLFGFVSCFFFFKYDLIRPAGTKQVYYDALKWGAPIMPHLGAGWIRQGADRYIINYFHSTYDVGIFSFALNLANVIIMVGSAFNSTNSVTLYQILSDEKLSNEEKKEKLNKQTRFIFLIYVVAAMVILVSMTGLTYIALPKYIESIPLMWVLAINGLGNCIYFLYCNYLFYYNETKTLMYITFGTSILHLLLSLALTRFSLYFTACIYGSMMIIMTGLVIWQAKKLIRINLA